MSLVTSCGLGMFLVGRDMATLLTDTGLGLPLLAPLIIAALLLPPLGALVDDLGRRGQAACLGGFLLLVLCGLDVALDFRMPLGLVGPVFVAAYALTVTMHASQLTGFPFLDRVRLGAAGAALQLGMPALLLVAGRMFGVDGQPPHWLFFATALVMLIGLVTAFLAVLNEEGPALLNPRKQIMGQMEDFRGAISGTKELYLTAVFFTLFSMAVTLLLYRAHDRIIDPVIGFTASGANLLKLIFAILGAGLARRLLPALGLKRMMITANVTALLVLAGFSMAQFSLELIVLTMAAAALAGSALATASGIAAGILPEHKAAQGFAWLVLTAVIGFALAHFLYVSTEAAFSLTLHVLIFAVTLFLLQTISPARAVRMTMPPEQPPPPGVVDLEWDWVLEEPAEFARHTAFTRFLRFLARTFAEIFFGEIRVQGRENLRIGQGAVIVANHPNTFFDPMLITAILPGRLSYWAKSTLWDLPVLGSVLDRLGAIPVYRRQDQHQGDPREGNRKSMEAAARRLGKGAMVLLFPEGVSQVGLSLKPVKTGAARLGFQAMEATDWQVDVPLIPIALDYSDPAIFRSGVTIRIGEPISLKTMQEAFDADPREAVVQVTDTIAESLKNMLPHLDNPQLEELVRYVQDLYGERVLQILEQEDETAARLAISEAVNHYQRMDPDTLYLFSERLAAYHAESKRLATPDNHPPVPFSSMLKFLVGMLDLASFGILINWIPYRLTGRVATAIGGSSGVWLATIKLAAGALVYGLWYLLLGIIGYMTIGPLLTAAFLLCAVLSAFLALGAMDRYAFRFRRLRTLWQLFWTQDTDEDLDAMRLSLIQDLERFRESYAFYKARETEPW
ncbi:MAG: 1-acyl-sn-glycerol-3-phosphate acyltransferase [Acidobacteriota bacterium]|nr:1-acyl-sn-glycerol-3-phosphate acyltransferase [Acidobacteriota bacterium]